MRKHGGGSGPQTVCDTFGIRTEAADGDQAPRSIDHDPKGFPTCGDGSRWTVGTIEPGGIGLMSGAYGRRFVRVQNDDGQLGQGRGEGSQGGAEQLGVIEIGRSDSIGHVEGADADPA